MGSKEKVACDKKEKCFFVTKEARENNHVCEYCTRNPKAKDPERDYSVAIQQGGY
jgi:hypothetical protein